jgi:8-oxo-dGTP pyrophosphatase MutT (NUDIX family)
MKSLSKIVPLVSPPGADGCDPWTRMGSRQVYVNPWIRVREDQVVRPDGKPGIYGVVEFANHALGVVPVAANGDTFLIGQFRYTLGNYSWEIPEGGGCKTVAELDSARRELHEEAGITANDWIDLGPLHLSNSVTDEGGRVYLARALTFAEAMPDGDEVLKLWRLPLVDAFAMCMNGQITDSVSIIGITRALYYLGNEENDAEEGDPVLAET